MSNLKMLFLVCACVVSAWSSESWGTECSPCNNGQKYCGIYDQNAKVWLSGANESCQVRPIPDDARCSKCFNGAMICNTFAANGTLSSTDVFSCGDVRSCDVRRTCGPCERSIGDEQAQIKFDLKRYQVKNCSVNNCQETRALSYDAICDSDSNKAREAPYFVGDDPIPLFSTTADPINGPLPALSQSKACHTTHCADCRVNGGANLRACGIIDCQAQILSTFFEYCTGSVPVFRPTPITQPWPTQVVPSGRPQSTPAPGVDPPPTQVSRPDRPQCSPTTRCEQCRPSTDGGHARKTCRVIDCQGQITTSFIEPCNIDVFTPKPVFTVAPRPSRGQCRAETRCEECSPSTDGGPSRKTCRVIDCEGKISSSFVESCSRSSGPRLEPTPMPVQPPPRSGQCRAETRCEDCHPSTDGGPSRKTCRVIDCEGQITTSFVELCSL